MIMIARSGMHSHSFGSELVLRNGNGGTKERGEDLLAILGLRARRGK